MKMKVLWVSVDPCGAKAIISPEYVLGGWLTALETALVNNTDIELHECFFCNKYHEDFIYNSVYNHPIYDSYYSSKRFFIKGQLSILRGKLLHDKRIDLIVDTIKKVQPDIVHIHGTETELGIIPQYIPNIPCILSIQGLISPINNKLYSGIPYSEIQKYDSIKKYLSLSASIFGKKGWHLYEQREKTILRNAKYLIGRTEWDKNVVSILAPKAKYYIGNEILRDPFYEAKPWDKKSYNDTFSIVSIITGGLFKGLETVLLTASLLKQNSFKFRWIIIGQTATSQNTKLYEKYTRIKGKDTNIEYVGRKTAEEVIELFHNSDLYVQTSHMENSPNSICEAMLLGMPVIATMAGGTATILGKDNQEFLIQDGEYYSLAGAILNISRNFDKALQQSARNRQIALGRHDRIKIAKEYIEAYKDVIGNS